MLDPHHRRGVLEVVDDTRDRTLVMADCKRVEHDPEQAAAIGKGAKLLVAEVPRMIVHGSTRGVRDENRRIAGPREDIRERRCRCMREVEDHAKLHEPIDEPLAEQRQPACFGCAVRVRVAAVPRQRRHPCAELPERVSRPHLVAELLYALQREEKADLLAAFHGVEFGSAANRDDAIRVLVRRPRERGRLRQGLAERPFRLLVQNHEDRAHLQPDAARGKEREPGLREDVRLTEPVLAVRELQQKVGVGVGEHRPIIAGAHAAGRMPVDFRL